jgi:hypothetical protein
MPRDLSPEATKLIDAALCASKRHGASKQSHDRPEKLRDHVAQLRCELQFSRYGPDNSPHKAGYMKDKRVWIGIGVTIIWLGVAGYMLWAIAPPDELNEWGDFFAGIFAPLAFLWLVLGYLQQGEELRHSTEALRLQAEELRNSVTQQSQLVAVSREQMTLERDALREERERRRDAARPFFVHQVVGPTLTGGDVSHRFQLVNIGNTATNFRLDFNPRVEGLGHNNPLVVARDAHVKVDLRTAREAPRVASIVSIRYTDAEGLPGEARFTMEVHGLELVLGKIERII